jgi:hypothetical protein
MLWKSASLNDKIRKAVDFYTEKYGQKPTLCMVNPATLNGGERKFAGVEIKKARSVMRDHFWIGIDEKPRRTRQSTKKAA